MNLKEAMSRSKTVENSGVENSQEKLGNQMSKVLGKLRNLAMVASFFTVVGTAGYKETHKNLDIKTNPDKKTTHYLNVLARKELFTMDDLVDDIRADIHLTFKIHDKVTPSEVDNFEHPRRV